MSSDKKKSSSGKLLASEDQIVIKQSQEAPTRYTGNLGSESEIVIRGTQDAKDLRY